LEDEYVSEERDETTVELTPEGRAIAIVRRDFSRAKEYLKNFHRHCVDRYEHYVLPALESNLKKDKYFPVPFITEQVDQLESDMMEKVWYKDEPCSIYGRNDTDKDDADVKREFMSYQDNVDDLHPKTRQAIRNCAICRIAPAVVNYKEEYTMQPMMEDTPAIDPDTGMPILDLDGVTPIMVQREVMRPVYTYQGATVELVDPIDFFWTSEKRELYDEHPMMIRSRCTIDWFKDKKYILHGNLPKLLAQYDTGGSIDEDDLLDDRREILGYTKDEADKGKQYQYIEWHGYADLDGSGKKKLYIIGVADDRVLLRLQEAEEIFGLGHPNIVVGVIGKEHGEIYGASLVDKIHSIQHGMDSLAGMWLKNLRQTANAMWVIDTTRIVHKNLENEAGTVIEVRGKPDEAAKRVEPAQISQDIYAGLTMFREMGQNASGLKDISSGVVQEGVETLGEADILASQAAVRSKGGYLRTFEKSFIEPLWKMRNQVNMKFCTDPGYMYSVLEDGLMFWKQATPQEIRSPVDFVCEASNRENQRGVITQQILQAVNLTMKAGDILGPIPLIKLLEKLYEEGFTWKRDEIKELLPVEAIAAQIMERKAMQQQEAMGQNPQSMPQPKTEGQARQSAQKQTNPNVGQVTNV
jgi:hypothetical protein